MENSSSLTRLCKQFSISRLGSEDRAAPEAVLYFWSDLPLVKIKHRLNQIFTGMVQGTDHFSSIFSN